MAILSYLSPFHWRQSWRLWAIGFILWAALLLYLSHGNRFPDAPAPPIPHFDKLLHFGYFLGGGVLLAGCLHLGKPAYRLKKILLVAIPLLSLIGAADEYHQSFFVNRSGNDPWDWLADTIGATAGVFLFWKLRQHVHPLNK